MAPSTSAKEPTVPHHIEAKGIELTIWQTNVGVADIPEQFRITLGEGETPLIPSRRLGPEHGMRGLWFKLESVNPSGSYKDRFAAVAISDMVARGTRRCVATSSGNTGSALAAYCAAADIACQIAIVEGAPAGKLLQMQAYGARLVRIRGFGTDPHITQQVFEQLETMAQYNDVALQISAFRYSPIGMSGVRSISQEIATQLPDVAHIFCPAGGGGLALAVADGFLQLAEQIRNLPCVECVQPTGNNTIAGPLRAGNTKAESVECTSQISGLQVASVIDGDATIAACRSTGGTGHVVDDIDVYTVQQRLARDEGIFCEPAAAISVAAALHAANRGAIDRERPVVCLVTGNGFKDTSSLERMAGPAAPLVDLHPDHDFFGTVVD